MKFGLYNAILHDRSLPEALKVIAGVGLSGIELNSGGFLPAVHIPTFDGILTPTPRGTTSSVCSRAPGWRSPA
jgi:sugar phosphate isomerase/epimerase